MKRLLLIFFAGLALAACEKPSVENDLIGSWKWVESTGGIAGVTLKPENGEVRILKFDAQGNFEITQNGQATVKTQFDLVEEVSILNNEKMPMIRFEDEGQAPKSFIIVGDSLYLNDEVYDGFSSKYVRL